MTGRLPFDPDKMARPRPPKDDVLSVSALAQRIDTALKQGIPSTVRVRGEISGFRERTHWYFDLKDADAVVSVVMFASAAAKTGDKPQNGQEVVIGGRIDFYAPQGKVSLIATSLHRLGAGELELRFRQLCEELRGLGWFAPDRKRKLPLFPRRIAVVTSRSAAALADVLDTARKRMPAVELVLVDVRVQGAGAAEEVAAAIRSVGRNATRLGIDAILVTRGGGSMEDLWAFNERVVALAIVECPIPVVAAIGHETDTTIAELAADERCATPTQAAMRLIPDRVELLRQVDALSRRVRTDLSRRVAFSRRHVESLATRPVLASGAGIVALRRRDLNALSGRLVGAARAMVMQQARVLDNKERVLARAMPEAARARQVDRLKYLYRQLQRGMNLASEQQRVEGLGLLLEAVSPVRVLDRGYSLTLDEQGRVVRSVAQITRGQIIETRLGDGSVHSVVRGPGPAKAVSRAKSQEDEGPQMDLFATPE
ncbi:MAG: exodeoxyribonuclease VII large subunit [Phycisphaeraceae bacterium]|nr:exodeoxyribonuclease VII large subunit [Phycisphaeraceae bacterium]MCW5763242.1 exodeoxyribonuclease VII large subunit [Phycisphaeraceae bacterium]